MLPVVIFSLFTGVSFLLQVLTNLATDTNISIILREFQTYIGSSDKEFVAATIQAIGRLVISLFYFTIRLDTSSVCSFSSFSHRIDGHNEKTSIHWPQTVFDRSCNPLSFPSYVLPSQSSLCSLPSHSCTFLSTGDLSGLISTQPD